MQILWQAIARCVLCMIEGLPCSLQERLVKVAMDYHSCSITHTAHSYQLTDSIHAYPIVIKHRFDVCVISASPSADVTRMDENSPEDSKLKKDEEFVDDDQTPKRRSGQVTDYVKGTIIMCFSCSAGIVNRALSAR